jgi:hypothetical protein
MLLRRGDLTRNDWCEMLVRFFRTLVIVFGFGLATPCQPTFAQEKPIHGDKDTKKSNPLVKTDHERPKPEPRPVQPAKATTKPKAKKGAPSNPAAVEGPRGVSSRAQRSGAARQAFERQTGYANGRPGYIVEHIVPLSCGGTDTPGNMEWLTLADARRKNQSERARCR